MSSTGTSGQVGMPRSYQQLPQVGRDANVFPPVAQPQAPPVQFFDSALIQNTLYIHDLNYWFAIPKADGVNHWDGSMPVENFDVGDYFAFDRANDLLGLWIDNAEVAAYSATGLAVTGNVSATGTVSSGGALTVGGDANITGMATAGNGFQLDPGAWWHISTGGGPIQYWDTDDTVFFYRNGDQWTWQLAGNNVLGLNTAGLNLYGGSLSNVGNLNVSGVATLATVANGAALGTPASINLANATNLPTTGLAGPFTGTGSLVRATSPTITGLTVTGGLGTDTLTTTGNATIGGTLGVTGTITGNQFGTSPAIAVNGPVATARDFQFQTSGSQRWGFRCTPTAESGGNAGSDLSLRCFSDTGTLISTFLTVTRATGLVTLANGLSITGGVAIAGTTAHGVLLGQGAGNLTSTAAGTAGQVLTSQGASADPTFTTAGGITTGFGGTAPTTNTTSTMAMAGQGNAPSNWVFTPTRNGRVFIMVTGLIFTPNSAAAGSGMQVGLYWGTGTPPANGAAPTGTSVSSGTRGRISNANGASFETSFPFSLCAFITTAAVGTQLWADIGQAQLVNGGNSSVQSLNVTFMEQ